MKIFQIHSFCGISDTKNQTKLLIILTYLDKNFICFTNLVLQKIFTSRILFYWWKGVWGFPVFFLWTESRQVMKAKSFIIINRCRFPNSKTLNLKIFLKLQGLVLPSRFQLTGLYLKRSIEEKTIDLRFGFWILRFNFGKKLSWICINLTIRVQIFP